MHAEKKSEPSADRRKYSGVRKCAAPNATAHAATAGTVPRSAQSFCCSAPRKSSSSPKPGTRHDVTHRVAPCTSAPGRFLNV